jgi:uncharacterized protein (TIGR02996 family)
MLMASVLANPEEDTPRLALADWLQEHGDEHDRARAEFIRLQIQAARLPEGDPGRKKPEARAAKLAERHRAAWLAPLAAVDPRLARGDPGMRPFARGLLKYHLFDTSLFLQKASQRALPDALAAVGVERLGFYSATKRHKDMAASPAFRWTAAVSYPGPDDAALAAIGAAPGWAHLSGLEFGEVKATDAGLKAFAKTSGTTRLTALGLASSGALDNPRGKYTAAGLLAVLASDRFPLLNALDLEAGQPVKFDWRTFFADAALNRLVKLRLPDAPMAAVAACRQLTGLRELAVNSGHITDADAAALVANPGFAKLARLELYGMNWGRPRLSKAVEKRLRERFGAKVPDYSPEER